MSWPGGRGGRRHGGRSEVITVLELVSLQGKRRKVQDAAWR